MFLALFFGVIDISHKNKWSFFLMVIGMNSIAAYCIADGGLKNVIYDSLFIHLGQNFDKGFGSYATLSVADWCYLHEGLILYCVQAKNIYKDLKVADGIRDEVFFLLHTI